MANIIVRRSLPARRPARRPRDIRWTADAFDIVLAAQAAPTGLGTDFVTRSDYDYSGGATEPRGATVVGIRLLISVASSKVLIPAAAVGSNSSIMLGVRRRNLDEPVLTVGSIGDPRVISELIDQDWMWLGQVSNRSLDVVNFDVKIKAKRKLLQEAVCFAFSTDTTGAGTGNVECEVKVRTLLQFH